MKKTSDRRKPEKLVLLLLAVMAIGMFALPSTLAMYSGQHDFVDADSVDCNRCHGSSDAIYVELNGSSAHEMFTCKDCHGFTNATVDTPNTDDGTLGHAATTSVSCIDCHAELVIGSKDMAGLDPDGVTVVLEITQPTAAHTGMYNWFNSASNPSGADQDDACIACHTTMALPGNVSYSPSETMPDLSTWSYT